MLSKEALQKMRREAYQRAKAKRDNNPAYQALKMTQKLERKMAYQAYKALQKEAKLALKRQRQEENDAALMEMVTTASKLETKLTLLKFDANQNTVPVDASWR